MRIIYNDVESKMVYSNGHAIWDMQMQVGLDPNEPFYIKARPNTQIRVYANYSGSSEPVGISYSTDGINWSNEADAGEVLLATLAAGEKLWLKHTGCMCVDGSYGYSFKVRNTSEQREEFDIGGNICSLYYEYDFEGQRVLPQTPGEWGNSYDFAGIFDHEYVVDASKLLMPTDFGNHTYVCQYMFQDCERLSVPPELPAMTLTNCCYESMFMNCLALTHAPVLPALDMNYWSYDYMFYGCSYLEEVRILGITGHTSGELTLDMFGDGAGECATNPTLYVPASMVSTWSTDMPENWTVVGI